MRQDIYSRIAITSVFAFFLSLVITYNGTDAADPKPASYFEIVAVESKEEIVHSIQSKSALDSDFRRTTLRGPVGFAHPAYEGAESDKAVFWNLYEISYGGSSEPTRIDATEPVGKKRASLLLGEAKFLLTKATWLTTGQPDMEEKIDFYKAYEILDGGEVEQEVSLSGSLGNKERMIQKASFLCLPIEEAHHDEVYSIQSPDQCLFIYQAEIVPVDQTLSAIDQFGLHSLTSKSSKMLLAPSVLQTAEGK